MRIHWQAEDMKAGVVAVQGDVSEHIHALENAMHVLSISGEAIRVRKAADVLSVDSLIIPGGESTTISKLLKLSGMFDAIRKRASEGMPLMGTCAGCILLAKKGGEQVEKTSTELLGLMDMGVDRNYFGRQRESFEASLSIDGLSRPFTGVFIRAPAIVETWGRCKPLAEFAGRAAMARQDNMLALAFHPELSADSSLHAMLLNL